MLCSYLVLDLSTPRFFIGLMSQFDIKIECRVKP
jgi:hypothetical protein